MLVLADPKIGRVTRTAAGGEGPARRVSTPPHTQMSEFHAACAAGDQLGVEGALRQAGPEGALDLLQTREPNEGTGQTPLHTACEHGHADVVQVLLEAAPYSSVLLQLTASRRPPKGKQRRSDSEPAGPPETPAELAGRLGQRKVLVAIDYFVDDEREKAQRELGMGLTLLSGGDAEGAIVAAKRGLEFDPQNEDCQMLFDMAASKLAAEAEALLVAGDPAAAAELATARLALAPESELLADVCGRSELLAAKLKAAKGRAVEVGNSLVEYERAATKMVSDALALKKKAEEGQQAAEAESAFMATWEDKCEEQRRLNEKLRGMWQARAIRKLRMRSIETSFEAWRGLAKATKRGQQIVIHAAQKIRNRWISRAWRGWVKYVQLAHVHAAEELAAEEREQAKAANRARQDAEWARDAAATKAESAGDRQATAEGKAINECNLRAAADRRAEAALADAARWTAAAKSCEANLHTREVAWLEEKKQRRAAEEDALDQAAVSKVLARKLEVSETALAELRRQAVASRYDAWSGRKVGKLPSIK